MLLLTHKHVGAVPGEVRQCGKLLTRFHPDSAKGVAHRKLFQVSLPVQKSVLM